MTTRRPRTSPSSKPSRWRGTTNSKTHSRNMRGYYVPLVAGILLTVSTFLPWVTVGETTLIGIRNLPAQWVAGLGVIATVLATLSLITRKNSRHPLLVV